MVVEMGCDRSSAVSHGSQSAGRDISGSFFRDYFEALLKKTDVPPKGGASGRHLLLTFLQVLCQGRNFALLPGVSLSAGENSYSERELVSGN